MMSLTGVRYAFGGSLFDFIKSHDENHRSKSSLSFEGGF